MKKVAGAEFKAKSFFFRPTVMSLPMADAGIIPAPHIIREHANSAVLRHKHDNRNIRPSIHVNF